MPSGDKGGENDLEKGAMVMSVALSSREIFKEDIEGGGLFYSIPTRRSRLHVISDTHFGTGRIAYTKRKGERVMEREREREREGGKFFHSFCH
jgi:hypothetical protein